MKVPVALCPHQHLQLGFDCFVSLVILVSLVIHDIVVLICIYLVSNDVKHILICLFAIHISSWVKYLFKSCVNFLLACFIIVFWKLFLYSRHKLSIRYVYFLPVCGLPLHSLNSIYQRPRRVLILIKSNLSVCSFMNHAFCVLSKKSLSNPGS